MHNDQEHQRLFPGFFRCERCQRDVGQIVRYRGWRLCPRCVEAVVPSCDPLRGGNGEAQSDEERREIARYWGWHWRRRRFKPKKAGRDKKRPKNELNADNYFPLCDCGRPRKAFNLESRPPGLFGGPFHRQCSLCEAREMVERLTASGMLSLHPDWDDEDWLDYLWRLVPEAYQFGLLPSYWYELKQRPDHLLKLPLDK